MNIRKFEWLVRGSDLRRNDVFVLIFLYKLFFLTALIGKNKLFTVRFDTARIINSGSLNETLLDHRVVK